MLQRPLSRFVVVAAMVVLAVGSFAAFGQDPARRGRKYKAPPPTARIEVTVLRDVNGKPIENAAVIFHPMKGDQDNGNMELKTNEDGKTIIDVLPIGDTVRMQIIAKGFQTYGQDYKIDKSDLAIEIRMKRPGEQYSIYKANGQPVENHDTVAPATGAPTAAGNVGKSPDSAPSQSQPATGQTQPK